MNFVINYYDSLGNKVSKETFDKEWDSFQNELTEEYDRRVDELLESIPESIDDEEKIKMIYMWIVDNVEYEHQLDYNADGSVSVPTVPIYNNWGIQVSDKRAPIILKKAICSGLSPFLASILKRLNIECHLIRGETRELESGIRLKHMWNVVLINGEYRHIDVTYGIFNKESGEDPLKYFNLSDEELQKIGPHTNYDYSAFKEKTL